MKAPRVLLTDVGGVLVRFKKGVRHTRLSALFEVEDVNDVKEMLYSEPFRELERGDITQEDFFGFCTGSLVEMGRMPGNWSIERFERIWVEPIGGPIESVVRMWHAMRDKILIASASNVDPCSFKKGVSRHPRIVASMTMQTHSFTLGRRKGDEDYFERLLSEVNASPEECVFVDDRLENIAFAKTAGIPTCWFADSKEADVEQLRRDLIAHGVPAAWLSNR